MTTSPSLKALLLALGLAYLVVSALALAPLWSEPAERGEEERTKP